MGDTVFRTGAQFLDYPMPRATGCPFDPPPEVQALGAEKPLTKVRIWDGSTPWLVTGHAAQMALLSDSRVSADDRRPGFPHWNEGMATTVDRRPRVLFNTDGAEHARFRRMLTRPFTFKRVEALRPEIQRITDELIDAMPAGPKPADLVAALALPVPSLVISELLGVPYEDHELFQRRAAAGVARYATREDSARNGQELASTARSSAGFRRCAWPSRPTRSSSSTTAWPTASTSCRSPGSPAHALREKVSGSREMERVATVGR